MESNAIEVKHNLSGTVVLLHGIMPIYDSLIEDPELGPLVRQMVDLLIDRAKQLNKSK